MEEDEDQGKAAELLTKLERPIETKNRSLRRQKSFKNVLEYIIKMKEDAGKRFYLIITVRHKQLMSLYYKKFCKIVEVKHIIFRFLGRKETYNFGSKHNSIRELKPVKCQKTTF